LRAVSTLRKQVLLDKTCSKQMEQFVKSCKEQQSAAPEVSPQSAVQEQEA
jgi:hypothetical protein